MKTFDGFRSSLRCLIAIVGLFIQVVHAFAAANDLHLIFDNPETASISGFRALWNTPIPLTERGAVQFTDTLVKDKSPTAIWSLKKRGLRPGAIAFDAL